jgi:hypothetical protein
MPRLSFTRLPYSPISLGLVSEFVSRFPPFNDFEFGMMVGTIKYQLETESHIVADLNDRVAGYLGWIKTTSTIADAWLDEDGPLNAAMQGIDAVAVTVLAVERPTYILPLIRHAKTLNPGCSVYWKRHTPEGRISAKRRVRKKG